MLLTQPLLSKSQRMVLLGEESKQEAPGNKGESRYQDKEYPVLRELLDSREEEPMAIHVTFGLFTL